MDEEQQRALAIWAVVIGPFAALAAFLWSRGALDWTFVAAYWVAPLSLSLIGVFPAPWRAVAA